MKKRISAILGVLALALGIGLAAGPAAHANTTSELYLNYASGWCSTELGFNVGSQVVLGVCVDTAASQKFHVAVVSGNIFQIVSDQSGLCVTYSSPEHAPDGGAMIMGNCAGANSQKFQFFDPGTGGLMYWMPDQYDQGGSNVTYDDANNVHKAYNKIDGSFFCQTCDSEKWSQLYTNG